MTVSTRKLRIATFNFLHKKPETFIDRFNVMVKEFLTKDIETILLQELHHDHLDEFQTQAQKHGLNLYAAQTIAGISTVAVLTKRTAVTEIDYSHKEGIVRPEEISVLFVDFGDYAVYNVHLPWGIKAENRRLQTVYEINTLAEQLKMAHPHKVIIMGGDYNTLLTSDTMRYLSGDGIYKETSTYWTNAWEATKNPFPTARKTGGWAEETAAEVGILHPELIPNRIIDNLMSYGWNYGKIGTPLSVARFGTSVLENRYGLSDHWGVTAEFLLNS